MHIAICDDNVADRKHIERLLSRESDKRAGTPNILYIDSFGHKDYFLRNPMKYDLVLMDMVSSPTLVTEILDELAKMNFDAPIALFSSTIDYTKLEGLPDNIIFLNKPYVKDDLPALLELGDKHVSGIIETLKVHVNGISKYLIVDEVLYCVSNKNNSPEIFLTNGQSVSVDESIAALNLIVEPYPEFARINKKVIVNMKYVCMLTPITVMAQDYRQFHYSPFRYYEMKEKRRKAELLV